MKNILKRIFGLKKHDWKAPPMVKAIGSVNSPRFYIEKATG